MTTPAIIQRTAQGEGSSERRLARSIRRSLSSDSIPALDVSQGRQDLFPGSHSCRKQPAQRAHENGKRDPYHHDFRADAEVECDFAESHETTDPGGDVIERKHQDATYQATD